MLCRKLKTKKSRVFLTEFFIGSHCRKRFLYVAAPLNDSIILYLSIHEVVILEHLKYLA
jgi:hypothetical protein